MSTFRSAAALLGLAVVTGCVSSKPAASSDAAVKKDLLRGVAQIHTSVDAEKLQRQIIATVARLRLDQGSTGIGRRARRLAIQGFISTLRGIKTQLGMGKTDSGNIEAAVRHAKQADRYLNRGATLLRAAGRVFGIRIGKLNGR